MTAKGVSWKYYNSDRGDDMTAFAHAVDGVPLPFHYYCGIRDPLTGYLSIMKNPSEKRSCRIMARTCRTFKTARCRRRRSFVHSRRWPGTRRTRRPISTKKFLQALIARVQSNPELWPSTAIFITTDEGGGFYDSGYIQPVHLLGHGTRYMPKNRPAIGDLMNLFAFDHDGDHDNHGRDHH